MKRVLFWALTISLPVIFLAVGFDLLYPRLVRRVEPLVVSHVAANLSAQEREAVYRKIAGQHGGLWEAAPEPDVARLARRGAAVTLSGAAVRINNAGLRASRPYGPKAPDVFRIVCVGDSVVFGMSGREEDRFCDQLAAFYAEAGVRPDGRTVEALALGLGSWTLVQQASYLASRISDYDPDVVVLLSVRNDITDAMGVTGTGTVTRGFSPEHRSWGSAFFSYKAGLPFGNLDCCGALAWDLSPESRQRWDKAMGRLGRLAELQSRRGKRILLSALEEPGGYPYPELFNFHVRRSGITAPLFFATFLSAEEGMALPHDPDHPSRRGHTVLRDQYVRALDRLGWLEVPVQALPGEDPRAPLELDPGVDEDALARFQANFAIRYLREEIDFKRLESERAHALLGGIFPPTRERALTEPPWASVRAGFVLRRPAEWQAEGVEVGISVPALEELFPFVIELFVDGVRAERFELTELSEAGNHRLRAPLPAVAGGPVVEVVLETGSYFTTIADPRMKSYRMLSARLY